MKTEEWWTWQQLAVVGQAEIMATLIWGPASEYRELQELQMKARKMADMLAGVVTEVVTKEED